ncbi:hypothetical protein EDC04DRAFT_2813385 [Pisolithus marmoratus]|nr:hypothetical protein EDC04DRAFT_2813385 [Pisolithus marmoratus]
MWASNRNRSSFLVLVLSTSSAALQRLNIRTSRSLSTISVQDQSTTTAVTDTLDSAAQEKGSLLKASHYTDKPIIPVQPGQKLMMFRLLGQMVVQDRPLTGPSGRPTCHGENTFVGMSNASSGLLETWSLPVQASNPHRRCRATAENR